MKLNNLVKRVIGALAGLFGLLFVVAGKNINLITKVDGKKVGEGELKIFDFLTGDEAELFKKADMFGLQRVLFWIAVVVIFAALAWFVFAVVAELVKNKELTKLANKFSKWVSVALVAAVVLLVVAGVVPHTEKTLKVTASVFSSVWFYLTAVCAVGTAAVEFVK